MEPQDISVTEPLSGISACLLLVKLDGRYRGWRVELCDTDLTASEEKLLLCSVCRGILREASLLEIEGRQQLRCYVCLPQNTIQPVQLQIPLHTREVVSEKQVICPVDACTWTGILLQLVEHIIECPLLHIPCPNNCDDIDNSEGTHTGGYRVERRYLQDHLLHTCPIRLVTCKYCYIEIRAIDMDMHIEECDDCHVECPNACDTQPDGYIIRRDISKHLATECMLQEVVCIYMRYGCEVRLERREMEHHEREYSHIHSRLTQEYFRVRIEEMEKIQEIQTDKIDNLERENLKMKQDLTTALSFLKTPSIKNLYWRVNGVKKRMISREESYSDPFYVGLYKLQARINWYTVSTSIKYIGVYIHVMQGEWDDRIKWPLMYKATFSLKNNLFKNSNYVKRIEVSKEKMEINSELFQRPKYTRNNGLGQPKYITHQDMLNRQYYHLDTLSFIITVQISPTNSQMTELVDSQIPCLRDSILNLNTQICQIQTKFT
ncbi:TNF receptor-associated factor 4-like isoform X1 [Oopsacas minuta]|uniref:TNF receptor-associated factor 4-like isoform X1 n=1 Tax=Oopsacas minuta TaxID=111878 RepID=A0AAV7KH99_9METZ|nr:TNF receptor-associated factor 4-like isoform X1 [Oopsacas minuta]